MAAALAGALVLACSGGDDDGDAARTPPAASPTAAATLVAATPTTDIGGTEIDSAQAFAHVRKLAVEIGPRPAGTPKEIASRDYIAQTLERYGYDVTIQDFPFDASAFLPVRVDAGGLAIPGYAQLGSASGTVTGRLVDIGLGRASDIPAAGLAGAIALAERGENPLGEKARNAMAAGAVGVIIYNNQQGRLSGSLDGEVAVPVAGIRTSDGEALLGRMADGAVDATISITPPQGTAYNVIARPAGVTSCAVVIGGHFDSVAVAPGADDNASGTGATLELARVLAARDQESQNCFALFGAEEFGLFGSKAFVEQLEDAELNGLRAMFNLDVVGVEEQLQLIGSEDLVETARVEAERLAIETIPSEVPNGAGSDHVSFQEAGVPVLMFYREDMMIHTPADAIDRLEAESLGDVVAVAIATLGALGMLDPG